MGAPGILPTHVESLFASSVDGNRHHQCILTVTDQYCENVMQSVRDALRPSRQNHIHQNQRQNILLQTTDALRSLMAEIRGELIVGEEGLCVRIAKQVASHYQIIASLISRYPHLQGLNDSIRGIYAEAKMQYASTMMREGLLPDFNEADAIVLSDRSDNQEARSQLSRTFDQPRNITVVEAMPVDPIKIVWSNAQQREQCVRGTFLSKAMSAMSMHIESLIENDPPGQKRFEIDVMHDHVSVYTRIHTAVDAAATTAADRDSIGDILNAFRDSFASKRHRGRPTTERVLLSILGISTPQAIIETANARRNGKPIEQSNGLRSRGLASLLENT